MKNVLSISIVSNILCLVLFSGLCNHPQKAPSTKTDNWTQDSTTHFVMYAQKGVRSEMDLKLIGQKLEYTQAELLHLLNETTALRLQIYFLKDRATLTSYTGFPANGYTDTKKGIVYFVDKAPLHLAIRHEIMHALSWQLWGPPKGYWLSEGIAVFASGNCGGNPIHALVQDIQKDGKLVSFENLTDTFDFKAVEPSLQSASMVKYIYDTYGVATLKKFWKSGWQNAQLTIGIPAEQLQKQWLGTVDQSMHDVRVDWSTIHTSGCE